MLLCQVMDNVTVVTLSLTFIAGEVLLDGYLYADVIPDECNWQLGKEHFIQCDIRLFMLRVDVDGAIYVFLK